MGQRDGFSEGDVSKLNAMYRCNNPQPSYSAYAPTASQYPYDVMFNYGGYSNGYGGYPTGGGYSGGTAAAAVPGSITAPSAAGFYGRRRR